MSAEAIEQWFVHYNPKVIDDVNIYPNVSIFNRKSYTLGDDKEVYIKFKTINADIDTYDELAMLETNACIYKISDKRYIVALKALNEKKLAVLGELSQRCIDKNGYNDLDIPVKDVKEWEIVPISYIYDKSTLSFDELVNDARSRVAPCFDLFLEQVKLGRSELVDKSK